MTRSEQEPTRKWQLSIEKNNKLVEKAKTDLRSLTRSEFYTLFPFILADILLVDVDGIFNYLEKLGVSRKTTLSIQGKISAGTFSPIELFADYYERFELISFGAKFEAKGEALVVIDNLLKFDFSTHPHWSTHLHHPSV